MDGIIRVTPSLRYDMNTRSPPSIQSHLQYVLELLPGAREEYQVCTSEIATQGLVGSATSDESLIEGRVLHVPRYSALTVEKDQLLVWIEHWSQDERDERVGLSLGRVWGKEAVH